MVFFADGVTSAVGVPASECETLVYKASLAYAAAPPGNCAFEQGSLIITTPDGVEHDVTPVGGIPLLGPPPGSLLPVEGTAVTYVVNPADVVGGQVIASTSYNQSPNFPKGISHSGAVDSVGFNNGGSSIPVDVTPCPDSFCAPQVCDPNATDPNFPGRQGFCVAGTPPVCPGDDCNTGICDPNLPPNGACAKTPVQDSVVCDSDGAGNPVVDTPGDCVHPGCEAGVCVSDHVVDPDSTGCTTVPDQPNDCLHPGCEGGVCVANHVVDPDSTVCGPDLDPTDAICPGCEGGVCVQAHIDCPKCGNRGDIRLASRKTAAQLAKAGTDLDALRIALRPFTTDVIDPAGKDVTVVISSAGGVVYSSTLPAGNLTLTGRYWRYTNDQAKYDGGISRLTIWRKPNGQTQIYVDAWGHMSGATSAMTTAVIIGDVQYNHDGTWKPIPAGWRLPNSNVQ